MSLTEKLKTYYATESGRSMIEMLGVLAIIGVLSIGGIAGYKYAIDKYYVNETMEELNSRAVTYATQVLTEDILAGEFLNHGEFGETTALGYTIEANNSYYPNQFEVTMTNYPSKVCRELLKNYTIPYQIVVDGKVYDPQSKNIGICGNEEMAPETLFVFETDLNQIKEDGLEGTLPEWGFYEQTATGSANCTPGVEFEADGKCYSCDDPGSYGISYIDEKELCESCPNREVVGNYCAKICESGKEFRSGSRCYSCESAGSYRIVTEEEYALCRACGRRMAVDNYCVPGCMAGQIYHAGQKKCITPECQTNSDCGSNEYCKLDSTQNDYSCEEKPLTGTCESVGSTTPVTVVGVGQYIKSPSGMSWWSAQNYCSAIGGRMATVSDFGCGYDFVGAGVSWGRCTSVAGNKNDDKPVSANMKAFQTAFEGSNSYWLSDEYNSCSAYTAYLNGSYHLHGVVIEDSRSDHYDYALCRVGN